MVRCSSVTGDLLCIHPVTDAEMKGWALGQVDDGQAGDPFGILVHDHESSEIAVRCEFGNLTDGELVRVSVRIAPDVDTVGEEVDQLFGFVVEG